MKCPITGRTLRQNWLLGQLWQPEEPYSCEQNPPGLNERIEAAGYNPRAFMAYDGAIPVLAYIVVDGERIAKVIPSRNRGRFGGWQVEMFKKERLGIINVSEELPATYEIEWLV